MAITSQTQGLDSKEQLVGAKGVQGRAQIAQDLDTHADREGQITKGLVEIEAVVARCWLGELREAGGVFAPVEIARVDNHACDCGAVATDPFLRRQVSFRL